jgi:hypothetical protein
VERREGVPVVMRAHPAADLFPMMTDEEVGALAVDIKTNGQRQPIILFEDGSDRLVLDGRNRLRACSIAGVEPTFIGFSGDPFALVVSANLHRRHLNESQRGMIAAKLATLRHGVKKSDAPIGASDQSEAADMLKVGRRTVQRARTVQLHGVPELIEAVESGRVKLTPAAELAQESPEEQRRTLAAGGPKSEPAMKAADPAPSLPVARDGRLAREVKPGLVLLKRRGEEAKRPEDPRERVRELARRGMNPTDIANQTGVKRDTVWDWTRDIRKKGVLENAIMETELFAESWDGHARRMPERWCSATATECKQLSKALTAAAKAAMKMVRRLNKEATGETNEAHEEDAQRDHG